MESHRNKSILQHILWVHLCLQIFFEKGLGAFALKIIAPFVVWRLKWKDRQRVRLNEIVKENEIEIENENEIESGT